ncbi:MAG: hypothetical protein QOH88_1423 [Verrucomicrobiota bacterium]
MIKRNFTAALIAAGMLAIAGAAQATVVDLINGDSGTVTNQYGTAIFQFTQPQPTGTGVIDPFLRIQNNGTEQGYNTSGGTPFDDKGGIWTHNITFSDLQSTAVTLNGTTYYKILLDVNEPNGAKSTVSLDRLQFYTGATGSMTTTTLSQLGTLRYDLDGGGDNQILFDASRNHGSGSGDAYLYIPATAFAGTKSTDYVYMYAAFGAADTMTNPDGSLGGFEEFALVRNLQPVPEMSAFFPIIGLLVAVGSTHALRRRRMARVSS